MDKLWDRVLPVKGMFTGDPSYDSAWEQGAISQRNDDWKRVKPLVEALQQISDMGHKTAFEVEARWGTKVAGSFPARIADKALAGLGVEVKK